MGRYIDSENRNIDIQTCEMVDRTNEHGRVYSRPFRLIGNLRFLKRRYIQDRALESRFGEKLFSSRNFAQEQRSDNYEDYQSFHINVKSFFFCFIEKMEKVKAEKRAMRIQENRRKLNEFKTFE